MTTPSRHCRRPTSACTRQRRGFTLIELLVVVVIVLLVSAVTLPVVLPALGNRQINEGARILQAALAGMRDAAIRADAPRGLRLLPDPLLNADGTSSGTMVQPGVLTYSRMIPIEPGAEYSQGKAQIVGDGNRPGFTGTPYYSPYPYHNGNTAYPYPPDYSITPPIPSGKVLRIEECAFNGPVPHNPTSWWWNVRVGDKIRIGDAGQYYTIVGPLTINPRNPSTLGQNPELFVNDGPPGDARTTSGLQYMYNSTAYGVEFLYVVNGVDDDADGFIDNGWDGLDNNLNGVTDEAYSITTGTMTRFGEWESETWLASLSQYNSANHAPALNLSYSITRRPVPSPSAREIALPGAAVIDASTWDAQVQERSRLPIDAFSRTVDVMVNQSGQVVSTFPYSSPSSFGITDSFYHFWVTDRSDVTQPNAYDSSAASYPYPLLPMPDGAPGYTGTAFLKKDRVLLTLFTRSGLIVTNSIENFDVSDHDLPYRAAQLGIREAK